MEKVEALLLEQLKTLQKLSKTDTEKAIYYAEEIRKIAKLIFDNRMAVCDMLIESYLTAENYEEEEF